MPAEWLAPTVISSGIAGGVAMATHFSASRAKRSENREDIRTEAFDQAKGYYTDVIERQDREISDMREQVSQALRRLKAAEDDIRNGRDAVRVLNRKLAERDKLISDLRDGMR